MLRKKPNLCPNKGLVWAVRTDQQFIFIIEAMVNLNSRWGFARVCFFNLKQLPCHK